MSAAEELERLDEALASGVKKVEYQDKKQEFHSIADMLAYRKLLVAKVQANGKITLGVQFPVYKGGFET